MPIACWKSMDFYIHKSESYKDIVKFINQGKIQVPLFMSSYTWKERDIINFLEYLQSGVQGISILLVRTKFNIASKRLSRNIPEKPGEKSSAKVNDTHYVLDGYHRLQSLYLAWYGSYMGQKVYFKTDALDENRFYLLKPGKDIPRRHKKLSDIDIMDSHKLPRIWIYDQMRNNYRAFHDHFINNVTSHTYTRCTISVIEIGESSPEEHTLRILDQIPDKRIIADRIRRFRTEMSPS